MRNFSVVSKKRLKQLLTPHGYKNWKRLFLKLNDNIFIMVMLKGTFDKEFSLIDTFVYPYPYCIKVDNWFEDYDPRDQISDTLFDALQRINPDKFTKEYYYPLIYAKSEEGTLKSLDFICETIEEFALSYMNKFNDLEFYYNEFPIFAQKPCNPNMFEIFEQLYGLSIKLRKYDNAIPYVDRKLSFVNGKTKRARTELANLKGGNFDERTLMVEKMKPGYIKLAISAAEKAIVQWGKEIKEWQIMKEALLSNDHTFLEGYIKKIESNSRKILQEMFGEK